MAADLNRYGRSVCFLPEYKETTSADAIIQFQKQWRIADFKHSTTDNYNTIATDIEKGFTQAQCVMLKMEHGNLATFKNIIEQLLRQGVQIGEIKLISKHGKIFELTRNELMSGMYRKRLRGKMK